MLYAGLGFLFGLLIPYIARRFGKFMPATGAYAIYRIVKPNKKVSIFKKKKNSRYVRLFKRYAWRSLMWGLGCALVSCAAYYQFGAVHIVWYLFLFWALMLLAEIDLRMMLLPDILTTPILIFGFLYAVIVGEWVGVGDSAMGAVYGYIIPIFASLFFVYKNRDVFGGGDVKLLAALGAWMGLEKLLYVIIISTILFVMYAIVTKRRAGAYGPAAAVATIAVAFWFF